MQLVLHQLFLRQTKITGPQASSARDSNKLFQDFYGKSKPNFVIQSCHERQIKSIDSKHLLNKNLANFQKSMEMGGGISILNGEETGIKNYVHTLQKQQTNNVHFPRIKNIQNFRTSNTKSNATGVTDVSLQQTSSSSLILRKVCLKTKNKSPNKKFRKCVKCLIFLFRIKRLSKRTLKRVKQRKKLSQNLLKMTEKMVVKYYLQILKVPLAHLQKIITNRTQKQPEYLMEEIATNLFSFSQILKNSSLRKDLLKFLSLLTLERTPLPFDFFCQFQLRRLNFSQNSFRLVQVTEVQVKMIAGIFLAVKVICIHLFGKIINL